MLIVEACRSQTNRKDLWRRVKILCLSSSSSCNKVMKVFSFHFLSLLCVWKVLLHPLMLHNKGYNLLLTHKPQHGIKRKDLLLVGKHANFSVISIRLVFGFSITKDTWEKNSQSLWTVILWGTLAERAAHLHTQIFEWWNTTCLFVQTGEAAHQNSMAVTASLKQTFLEHHSIYRQSKTSCLLHSNPHGGTCSIHNTSSSFIYNAGPPHQSGGLCDKDLLSSSCQLAHQTLRRNAH